MTTAITPQRGSAELGQKLITIVISLKSNAAGLAVTLKTIADQRGRERLTVLIMDSNSSDFPIDVVERYNDKIDIDFVAAFDRGIYHSWNRALGHVRTPWITFFGSGDTFCPGAIGILVDYVESDPPTDIVSSKSRNMFKDGASNVRGRLFEYSEFSHFFSINHSGTLYRAILFGRYGNFDERYRSSGDYEFLLRVGKRARFGFIDAVISEYLVGGISSSSTLPLKETFAVRKRYKSVTPIENQMLYWRGVGSLYFGRFFR